MKASKIMSAAPVCCTPGSGLQSVASLMVFNNCGAIPVVEDEATMKMLGIVTDRDIVCRAVAQGKNPLELSARDCMTTPVATVAPDDDLQECIRLMEQKQVRRIPVVDDRGCLCGIVSQADIARCAPGRQTGEVVEEISRAA